MAAAIGRREDVARYLSLFEQIKASFNRHFVNAEGRVEGNTQGGYALALSFDLLPEAQRPKAVEHLLEAFKPYHGNLSTGIQASHRLMLELSRNGRTDEAYRLINLRTPPSWGYMIDQGATTVWERWDGYVEGRGFASPSMNSFNRCALGSVGEWIFSTVLGIRLAKDRPGYKHFILRPQPGGGLEWVLGSYESIRGRIAVNWKLEKGDFTINVTIPANTTATLWLPARAPANASGGGNNAPPWNENMPGVAAPSGAKVHIEPGSPPLELESGTYDFAVAY
jgi:alpha-L-rhamnosidase